MITTLASSLSSSSLGSLSKKFSRKGILKDNVNNEGNTDCRFPEVFLFDMEEICVLFKYNDGFLNGFGFKNFHIMHNGENDCAFLNIGGGGIISFR